MITLTHKPRSSSRTKNRIKENGPHFREVDRKSSSLLFGGHPAILVRSSTTDWMGWLPLEEVVEDVQV